MDECLKEIDLAFMYSIRKVKSFSMRENIEGLYWPIPDIEADGRCNFSETILISQLYRRCVAYLTLKQEINSNILERNVGYFDLLRHIFEVHFFSLIKVFNDIIPDYFIQNNLDRDIKVALRNSNLTVAEAQKIVILTLIHHFFLFEELLENCYPKYDRLLKTDHYDSNLLDLESNFIKLKYTNNVLEIIYSALKDSQFINLTFFEFKSYFGPRNSVEKIFWYGSEVAIVILFMGHENVKGLNVLSKDSLQLIPRYFLKADGTEFKITQLRVVYQKVRQKPRGTQSILKLLSTLNS
jgi:hypothetical protein